jgi:hypothetical protein
MRSPASVQAYARAAGILFLISMIAGGFGEFYAPTMLIVSGNAAATANNVLSHPMLFRFGFAAYLIEAGCDITLAWIFYVLLRPTNRNLSLLAAFFGLVSTATFATTELFYFAPSFILGGAGYLNTFSADQLNSLALLSFRFYIVGAGIFMEFYGVAWILRGYLIYRSGYLPKWTGALAVLAGFGFVAHNFTLVLAQAYASDLMLAPMFLAGLTLTGWLILKGVDLPEWSAKADAAQSV